MNCIYKKIIGLLVMLYIVFLNSSAFGYQPAYYSAPPDTFIKDELILKFRTDVKNLELNKIYGAYQVSADPVLGTQILKITNLQGKNLSQIRDEYRAAYTIGWWPDLKYVELNYRLSGSSLEYKGAEIYNGSEIYTGSEVLDAASGGLYAFDTLRASEAAKIMVNHAEVIVAVLDTGLDLNSPEFASKIVPGKNILNNSVPQDDNGHGTEISGTIVSKTYGITSLISEANQNKIKIMPIKVLSSNCTGDCADVAAGLRYAADHDADIILLSIESTYNSILVQEAVNYAYGKGITVVAAAGSTYKTVSFPAKHNNVISVGSTNFNDLVPSYSSYGSKVDVTAPGDIIATTTKDSSAPVFRSGTSLAAGYVAGTVALMLSENNTLTPDNVSDILKNSSLDFGEAGSDSRYGAGRIDILAAVQDASLAKSSKKDSFEPNGSFAQAYKLNSGRRVNAYIFTDVDEDYFVTKRPIGFGHSLKITVNVPVAVAPMYLAVYDKDKKLVIDNQVLNSGENIINVLSCLTDTYYFKVWAEEGKYSQSAKYSFEFNDLDIGDSFEPNNTFTQATSINDGQEITRLNLAPAGDVDIFKYANPSGNGLNIAVKTPYKMTAVVKVFTSDGTLYNGGSYKAPKAGDDLNIIVPVNTAGTYYVEVSEASPGVEIGGENTYSIKVNTVDTLAPVINNYKVYNSLDATKTKTGFSPLVTPGTVTGEFKLSEPCPQVSVTLCPLNNTANTWTLPSAKLIANGLDYTFTWDGKRNGSVVADGEYVLKVDAKDINGNVAIPLMKTVWVDSTPPKISFCSPAAGSSDVSVNTYIEVNFDEAIDPIETSLILKQGGATIACTPPDYDATTHVLRLQSTAKLEYSLPYTVQVVKAVDEYGNVNLDIPEWSFTTAGPDAVSLLIHAGEQVDNSINLTADVSSNANGKDVNFEYSKDGITWTLIGKVLASNGKTDIAWNVAELYGTYQIRASVELGQQIFTAVTLVNIEHNQVAVNVPPGSTETFFNDTVAITPSPTLQLGTVNVKRLDISDLTIFSAKLYLVGEVVDLSAETKNFEGEKVKITFKYDPDKYVFIDETTVAVYYFNPSKEIWEKVDGAIDKTKHTVSAELTHFSQYAVLGEGIKYYLPTPKKAATTSGFVTTFIADNVTNYPYEIYLPNEAHPESYRIHTGYTKNTDACASCHKTHTAVGESLLQWYSVFETCMACHDGTVNTTYNVVEGITPAGQPAYGGMFGLGASQTVSFAESYLSNHNVSGAVQISAAPGGSVVAESLTLANGDAYTRWANALGCESCHSPHGQGGNARILAPDPNGYATKNFKKSYNVQTVAGVAYILDEKGKYVTLIQGYPYEILVRNDALEDISGNFTVSNVGDAIYGSYTVLAPKDEPSMPLSEIKTVSGTASVKVRMQVADYLQPTERVRHISGVNLFCVTCHTDYNTEGVVEKGNNIPSGEYSKAHRHSVGIDWNFGGDADGKYIGRDKIMITYGETEAKQYISCLTCHFAHGTGQSLWERWLQKTGITDWNKGTELVEIAGSSALKRLPNMGTCEACHQKGKANEGYNANSGQNVLQITGIVNGLFSRSGASYVGVSAGECQKCHSREYKDWYGSRHRRILSDKDTSILAAAYWAGGPGKVGKLSGGGNYSITDVVYTVGFLRSQQYIVRDNNVLHVLPYRFMVRTATWVYVNPVEGWGNVSYQEKCIGCHSTGYDNLTGTMSDMGVTCEACHGPASNHVKYPSDKNIFSPAAANFEQQIDVCGQCHALGKDNNTNMPYPAGYIPGLALSSSFNITNISNDSDGDGSLANGTNNFWPDGSGRSAYMEYNDFISDPDIYDGISNHNKHYESKITCITCHGDCSVNMEGKTLKLPDNTICASCHDLGSSLDRSAIVDKFMPPTAQSVSGRAYDLRSHRFIDNPIYPSLP